MLTPVRTLSHHCEDFIHDSEVEELLRPQPLDIGRFRGVVAKALDKQALTVDEAAVLLRASPELRQEVLDAARELKRKVYGNRIVLFAPLYIGNFCVNDCTYCGFRRSNRDAVRRTLTDDDVTAQVKALEDMGHKRIIVVFGEHPAYGADVIARTVENIYRVRSRHGEIRRVNINAAPLDVEGFRRVKEAGIGTYQIFQETYHHATFAKVHPAGTLKNDYLWRLDAMGRAFDAGVDDVGIGALFGLYDWRFEVLGLVTHARYLQSRYGCGPHTISFPRLRPASGNAQVTTPYAVDDDNLKFVIAVLRLSVPYTGLILTAREPAELRREALAFGVSQIDAGSRVELGGYTEFGDAQQMDREQFELGDVRPLDAIMRELLTDGYVPSFCTACYRLGRTGQHFMEFAIPGFIQTFCTPNALTTLMEYLVDYASEETRAAGLALVAQELGRVPEGPMRRTLEQRLNAIQTSDSRDLYV
ncbi:MAG: [FeFe] hydrogenase H-cluster radical SAM maturase HydG [Polyangiaceae bacterium]|jgi:2-iminoacetate synthase